MNLLRVAGKTHEWGLQLGRIARIWKGGCIIRAQFLGRIKEAYERNAELPNLLVDAEFAREMSDAAGGLAAGVALARAARAADADDDGVARLLRLVSGASGCRRT